MNPATFGHDPQNPWAAPGRKGPLLAAVVLACLLHLVNISIPTLIVCLAMWAWHFIGFFRPLPRPGPRLITVMGALFFALAAATHEGVTVEAFVALLVLMIALKLFELRHLHDATMTVILNYFVIVSGMFFSDSLLVTGYIALCLVYNTAALVHVNQPGMKLRPCLRVAGRLTAQALPFMVVLFLVFPRFQGGLWGRPQLIQDQPGISDTIRMGSIAQLGDNPEVAFRVQFEGPVPPPNQLYWRGIVLWQFDGLEWKRGRYWQNFTPERPLRGGAAAEYTVTLEPHQQRWLYTLDRPLNMQPVRGVRMGPAQVAETWRPVTSRMEYRATSDPGGRLQQLQGSRTLVGFALQLPEDGNPRARALAAELRQGRASAAEVVNAALSFYRQGGFRYTLRPGTAPEPENAVDHFLFENRNGFCEHFATSFAFLMRAAGVPARLVGGYLGGAVNPLGDYLIVRQRNAHVWCEVLADGEWHRVDPTAAVAPGRLRPESETETAASDLTLEGLFNMGRLRAWLGPLGNAWDLVNMRWNQWVMQYSAERQSELFSRLGIDVGRSARMISLFIVGLAVLGIGYFTALVYLKGPPTERDPVARDWRRFLDKLERGGIPRNPAQGPQDLLAAIRKARPDLREAAEAVIRPYIRLRYAAPKEEGRTALQRDFAAAARRFAVSTRKR